LPYAVTAVGPGDAYVTDGSGALVDAPLGTTPIQIGNGTVAPLGLAWDSQGDVFIADPAHNQVEEIKADGSMTTVGLGLNQPYGVAVDSSGDVFIADSGNNRVVEVKAGVLVTVSPAPPVTVASVVINDGSAQRSVVRSIRVTFSGPVTFTGGDANAAFQLARTSLTGPTGNVDLHATVTSDAQNRTIVTLTFSGALTEQSLTAAGVNPSLIDGLYTLTVFGNLVTGPGGHNLDGDDDGTAGGDKTFNLHRLFGDVDGDRDVDLDDIFPFLQAAAFASPLSPQQAAFDFEGDGDVDLDDIFSFFVPRLFARV
jgi:hypothetical protein